MAVEPLSSATLPHAIAMAEAVFQDPGDLPRASLEACLAPQSDCAVGSEGRAFNRRCWCWVDDGEVMGLVCLCQYVEDCDYAIHLEWFCTSPAARRRGIGTQLLEHALAEARHSGKTMLRLTTSTEPEEEGAQRLYEKYGIFITKEEPQPYRVTPWSRLYREIKLR